MNSKTDQMRRAIPFLCLLSAIIYFPTDAIANTFVFDDATAIAIAKAVLRPLVDRDLVDGPKALAFYTSLEGPLYSNVWYAENAPPNRQKWVTPIAHDISPTGFVPDKQTAKDIAKAVIRPRSAHTLYARPNHDTEIWLVEDALSFRKKWTMPVMRVEIEKKFGRVLSMGYE